jgi:putative addiction module component (TIGR02574 family)
MRADLFMTFKAQLIDKLISSLDKPDKEIDELWTKEAEDRIDAYDQGKLKAVSLEKVLQKIMGTGYSEKT